MLDPRKICRFDQQPNIIIQPHHAHGPQDCGSCGAYRSAANIALVPSMARDYRVVGICQACTNTYLASGAAIWDTHN